MTPQPARSRIHQYCVSSAIRAIQLYRLILSPIMGNQCRFYPSCSHYSEEAFQQHGFFMGVWLTLKRLGKCHPWHTGGFDYVPAANVQKANCACTSNRKTIST